MSNHDNNSNNSSESFEDLINNFATHLENPLGEVNAQVAIDNFVDEWMFDLEEESAAPELKRHSEFKIDDMLENSMQCISNEELEDIFITKTAERLAPKGSIHGIRASHIIHGSPENWEIFGDYYQSPKDTKKCVSTKWLTLTQLLEKASKDYDVQKDSIDCSKWGGIPGAAFTCKDLEDNLSKTVTNYKLVGVPLTFGMMSALLFLHGLTVQSAELKTKFGTKYLKAFPNAFIAAELGQYEGGPLGGMNPEILTFLFNMYSAEYRGEYKSENYSSPEEEWKAVFGKNWTDKCKTTEVFELIRCAFNLCAIAKLLERGNFNEKKCPNLMAYTFSGFNAEEVKQLAILCMIHRRAAQGLGISAIHHKAQKKALINFLDRKFVQKHFSGDSLMEISTRKIISYMDRIVSVRSKVKGSDNNEEPDAFDNM
jgi:hypothetical protein